MQKVSILVGSQMGGVEYLADQIAIHPQLSSLDFQIFEQPDLNEIPRQSLWLICTSTYGAGDYPENIIPFIEQLHSQKPDLCDLKYAIIGVGDSSYDTFCEAAKNIDNLFNHLGAQRIFDRLEIDILQEDLPEDTAIQWMINHFANFV
ncbi:FMN-binding protein MioC [Algicola sagamiensis]|uniref:FMN-binding protein MioC n=1 Tax=Algicola sagamiensis TaxID=163869 RepID=UPI00037B3097|nr:FMN-binding protein MioC [Algicola sagamiensis]